VSTIDHRLHRGLEADAEGRDGKRVPAGALDEEVPLAAHTAPVAHPSHAAEGGNVVNPGVHHVLVFPA
jgi:hypothetical protein